MGHFFGDELDVSEAVRDILEFAPAGGIVEVEDPPTRTVRAGRPIYQPGARHRVRALVLPPGAPFSGRFASLIEDFGMLQPDERWCFVLEPLIDEDTGEEVAIHVQGRKDAGGQGGVGSTFIVEGERYRVVGEAFDGQVAAGYRSYKLKKEISS